jgi:hypothetical protein
MRSARGDVRAHIVYPRTTTDLRIGFSGHCTATNTLIHVTVARLKQLHNARREKLLDFRGEPLGGK